MVVAAKVRPLPLKLPKDTLDRIPFPCFGLTESLEISYCNPAWDSFAGENGGSHASLRSQVVSRNLLDFIPADLKEYYAGLFAQARAQGSEVSLEYECSSPRVFRLFRMQIYPLQPPRGFVVINSLMVEHPHGREAYPENDEAYKNSAGMFRMCANCRRTNRAGHPDTWDWVPAYLSRTNVTHGVCPVCLDYYYHQYVPLMNRILTRKEPRN